MNEINEYFKKKTENLSFIEIKPNSYVEINSCKIGEDTPLPLITEELIKEIKNRKAQEEIKISSIINGIIYTIGVDPDFKYAKKYIETLYNYDKNIEQYILFKGLKLIDEGAFEDGMVYFRALVNINDNNLNGIYNLALSLEEKARRFYVLEDTKMGDIFLKKSTDYFEKILRNEPKFSLAYYKLGYHYKNSKEFKKSQEMWEMFLRVGGEESLMDEVRELLQGIQDDIAYEVGYKEILSGKPKEGLEKLLPLKARYEQWWNLYFMIGLGFRQLGDFQMAKEEFEMVLAINPNQVDALNELGLCLASLGQYEEAIDKFSEAIIKKPKDFEIMCNRGMTYLEMREFDKGTKDIEDAFRINPKDEVTIACKKEIDRLRNMN